MAARKAILDFIALLEGLPAGEINPSVAAQLPAVVVSLRRVREGPIGVGGLVARGELTGTRTAGLLQAGLWAADADGLTQLADGVSQQLQDPAAAALRAPFVRLSTRAIQPAETVALGDGSSALRQSLIFTIVHEEISTTTGPDGTIQEIDVVVNEVFNESMTLRKP